MPNFPFMQVDAFTESPLTGNACAIVFDADDLDTETMQAVAREMNLSETSFVLRSAIADFRARYFTPGEEIPLAGHPTIATAFALADSGRLVLETGASTSTSTAATATTTTISLELPVGPIRVDIDRAPGGGMAQATMYQKRPEFLSTYTAAQTLPLFGLTPGDLLPGAPIQTVSTGTAQLMVPVRDLETVRRARFDARAYDHLRRDVAGGEFFSVHLFCLGGATADGATFARHFTGPPGAFEDPFTGSATGGMAAYLWHHGLIESPVFRAEQGHDMHRPGVAQVEVVGPRDEIETVKVGGPAVRVLRGELTL